ncbi:MAG: alpha/beta hydrolase [Candidatus Binatia bacterium]|nr:alpha/beta hydrolase [Candidatus Binatia bacterium]
MSIDREIELPGRGRTQVRDIPGPAGAPAVVLLHGLGATGRLNWGPCLRPLSEHFRVVCVDHRGHGQGLRTSRFRLADCADDAVLIAEQLDLGRFLAVGYSMGGPIASLTWHRHPEHVAGLVLCATARHFMTRKLARGARMVLASAAMIARLVPGAAQDRFLARMLARVEHPQLRERIVSELSGHEPSTVIQAAGAVARFSSHDWIGRVDVPTSVIVTTKDELVPPARQRKLAASIPNASAFEVHGNHAACIAKANVFAPTLVRACRDVARRADFTPRLATAV